MRRKIYLERSVISSNLSWEKERRSFLYPLGEKTQPFRLKRSCNEYSSYFYSASIILLYKFLPTFHNGSQLVLHALNLPPSLLFSPGRAEPLGVIWGRRSSSRLILECSVSRFHLLRRNRRHWEQPGLAWPPERRTAPTSTKNKLQYLRWVLGEDPPKQRKLIPAKPLPRAHDPDVPFDLC